MCLTDKLNQLLCATTQEAKETRERKEVDIIVENGLGMTSRIAFYLPSYYIATSGISGFEPLDSRGMTYGSE